jgi:hypothetical protein
MPFMYFSFLNCKIRNKFTLKQLMYKTLKFLLEIEVSHRILILATDAPSVGKRSLRVFSCPASRQKGQEVINTLIDALEAFNSDAGG